MVSRYYNNYFKNVVASSNMYIFYLIFCTNWGPVKLYFGDLPQKKSLNQRLGLFTIYLGKPVCQRFIQMVRKMADG